MPRTQLPMHRLLTIPLLLPIPLSRALSSCTAGFTTGITAVPAASAESQYVAALTAHAGACPTAVAYNLASNGAGCCPEGMRIASLGRGAACCACGARCTGFFPSMVDWDEVDDSLVIHWPATDSTIPDTAVIAAVSVSGVPEDSIQDRSSQFINTTTLSTGSSATPLNTRYSAPTAINDGSETYPTWIGRGVPLVSILLLMFA